MNNYISRGMASRHMILSFFAGIAFGGILAYVWTDDARIEREQEQLAQASQIVKKHYAKECAK